MSIKTSAPGSLMVMGEHAVLHGYPALITAINKRLSVQLTPRRDRRILIDSALGTYQGNLESLNVANVPSLRFALKTLEHFQPQLNHGLELIIDSEIDATKGLGSSAALVVALVSGLSQLINPQTSLPKKENFLIARNIIRKVQGLGSGSDVAASLYGGLVVYNPTSDNITQLKTRLFLCAIYAGYKIPTPQVIEQISQAALNNPEKYKILYEKIGATTEQGIKALESEKMDDFIQAFQENQSLMVDLGVSDETLDRITHQLLTSPNVLGAKISGSGLGDCVLGLLDQEGGTQPTCPSGERLDVSFSSEGLRHD